MQINLRKNLLLPVVLAVITFSFVVPKLLRDGLNIVTHTYESAALRISEPTSPYLGIAPHADQYKYAPVFALFYWPLTQLPMKAQVLCWAFLNSLFFWLGICRWLPQKLSLPLWGGLILCSMELNGPLLYQQINALLIGVSLLALAFYRDKKYFLSGGLLMLVSLTKILPLVFLLPLLFRGQRNYFLGCVAGFAFGFLSPALYLGWERNLGYHAQWAMLLFSDTQSTGILDVRTILGQLGYSALGDLFFAGIFIFSGLILLLEKSWPTWISISCLAVLLLSPRTESPTFVFGAPAFLLLLVAIQEKRFRQIHYGLYVAGAVLMTLSFNDIWPKSLWNPHSTHNFYKTLGAVFLWLCSVGCLTFLPRIQVGESHADELSQVG